MKNTRPHQSRTERPNNSADSPTTTAENKTFATLQAQFALKGHALIKADPTMQAAYYVTAWGYIKPLADLDAAAQFFQQIGGAA